jgi:Ala-tRNA(Pro) deacylase
MTVTQLQEALDRAHVPFDLIEHKRTQTAGDEATAVGVPREHVAKTIIISSGAQYVRAVLPASTRVDLHKVRAVLGDEHARLATEPELVYAYPEYELGAVPPFGAPAGDRVLVDRGLAEREWVVVEAGAHNESLRLETADLIGLCDAQVEEIAAP